MKKLHTAPIRALLDQLACAAAAFPDFHYAEFAGPGVGDDEVLWPLVDALAGGRETEVCELDDEAGCLYGFDLADAIAVLRQMTDAIAMGVRLAARQFPGLEATEELPIPRGERAPFQVAGAMLRLSEAYPDDVRGLLEPMGVTIDDGPANPRFYSGVPVAAADGAVITFPGDVVASRPDRADWSRLIPALARGDIGISHSTASVFAFTAAFFEADLVKLRVLRDLSDPDGVPGGGASRARRTRETASPSHAPVTGFLRLEDIRVAYPGLTENQLGNLRKQLEEWRNHNEDAVLVMDEDPDSGRRRYAYPAAVVKAKVEAILARAARRQSRARG
jgi:hypothetical protein